MEYIQIWYSWGDMESPVEVPDGEDAFEYMKKIAVDEACTSYVECECDEPIGLSFFPDQDRIVLHYPNDGEDCYYQITDEEEFEPG